MLEEIYFNTAEDTRRQRERGQVHRYLRHHRQLQVYARILADGSISEEVKVQIRKPRYRKALLKRIRDDLDDRLKPQESFEVWNQHSADGLYRTHTKDVKLDEVYDNNTIQQLIESAHTQDDGGDDDDDDIYKTALTETNIDNIAYSAAKIEYLIKAEGLEALPNTSTTIGTVRYHLYNLRFFLHRSILSRNWDLAYRIFCLLVRVPGIDIRSLWPLGIEILRGQAQTHPDEGFLFVSKEDRFFTWLSSFFVNSSSRLPKSMTSFAPGFRSGSKSHVPLYVITSIWSLMERGKYKKVREDLSSLLYERPFNENGVFPFMIALCLMAENIKLAQQYERVDRNEPHEEDDTFLTTKSDIYAKISENFKEIDKNLDTCKKLDFLYPEELIEQQTNMVLSRLNSTESDDDEAEDDKFEEALEELNDSTKIIDDDADNDVGEHMNIAHSASPPASPEEPYWSDEGSSEPEIPDRQMPASPNNDLDFDFDFD